MLIACATIVERPARIAIDHRFDELVERNGLDAVVADARHQLQRGQGVARRSRPLAQHLVERGVTDLEAGVVGHPSHMLGQRVGRQEVELEVLRAAPDGVGHLLRVGRGEHEHDVRRRLLERLQQGCLGRLGEHVHLVEDVHLVAPRRAERRLLDEVAHRVDAVVARRVEFVDVVARAPFHGETRLALTAGLTVDRIGAVEDLGEDARRGGLAGATRAREQIGLALASLGDRGAQGLDHVVLAFDLTEPSGPVAAVQRLGGHRGHDTQRM